jgi:ATP-dependent RNA circularization protein (DNA/RNA ligase family)
MLRYCDSTGRKGLVIQGELCGPGIQKNVYGFSGLRFFVFGILELDGERLGTFWMSEISNDLGLETVPVICRDKSLCSTIEMVLADCKGRSKLADVPREGLVWRANGSDLHFKAKSREYKVWYDRRNADEES